MPAQLNFLGAARVNRIVQGLQDPRLLPQQLVWSRRITRQKASDEEITARFIGTVQIADMIADDARGVTYSMGQFRYETTKIPNIKVGVSLNQAMLNKLGDLLDLYGDKLGGEASQGSSGYQVFTNWENRALEMANLGVQQRVEQLCVAMLVDGQGFSYDRFGIKMTGATWGMFQDLKVTPSVPWATAGSATPVDDILALKLVASTRYGITYNRITMSTQALRYMVATTEFQNKARMLLAPNVSFTNISLNNLTQLKSLAESVLQMTIELYDARYWQQDAAGALTQQPYLPLNLVVLTDSSNDGNSAVWDFAQTVITEGIIGKLAPVNVIGGGVPFGFGPTGYCTAADANLNPPGIVYWAVDRGFPRKFLQQASAVLNIGAVTDVINTTLPAIV